jgi:hypothetical protein
MAMPTMVSIAANFLCRAGYYTDEISVDLQRLTGQIPNHCSACKTSMTQLCLQTLRRIVLIPVEDLPCFVGLNDQIAIQ